MLYSHIRFFIAGVEMPVSGPLYITGGMMTATLSYVLNDPDPEMTKILVGASPLSRTRYEAVPVKVAGSLPETEPVKDDAVLASSSGDDNYPVLFDGYASMTVQYNYDTKRLDISLSAVPGTVHALNNIVYSNLTVGSYVGGVEGTYDTAVQNAASEASGNKTLATGFGPNTMNSDIFLKKVVTGKTTKEIERPTDMLEFALSNILKYAGAEFMRTSGNYPLRSKSEEDTFIYLSESEYKNASSADSAGNSIPEAMGARWKETLPDPEHGDEKKIVYPDEYHLCLPDFIMRKTVLKDFAGAAATKPELIEKLEVGNLAGNIIKSMERTSEFVRSTPGGLWVHSDQFIYLAREYYSDRVGQVLSSASSLPKWFDTAVNEASRKLYVPQLSLLKRVSENAPGVNNKGQQSDQIRALFNLDNNFEITTMSVRSNIWRFFTPENVALLNAYFKSLFTVFGMTAVRTRNSEHCSNLLSLLYAEKAKDEVFEGFRKYAVEHITLAVEDMYRDLVVLYYESMQHIINQMWPWSKGTGEVDFQKASGIAGNMVGVNQTDYFNAMQPTKKEWEDMSISGRLVIKDASRIVAARESGGSFWEKTADRNPVKAWVDAVHSAVLFGIDNATKIISSLAAGNTYGYLLGFTSSDAFTKGADVDSQVKGLAIDEVRRLTAAVEQRARELDTTLIYDREANDPSLFDIKAAKAILDASVQNKVGAIDFLRTGKDEKQTNVIYPNLALSSLDEFRQLVSNTSGAEGNGSCTLYSMLRQLYSKVKLVLTTPLNKPYADQNDKQTGDRNLELYDKTKSVMELMPVTVTETWPIPKCNVFCIDRSRPEQAVYNQSKNATNILIRYAEPVSRLEGVPTQGAVPARYYRFDITDPQKIFVVKDPKAAFADDTAYSVYGDSGATFSYKNGLIYDMYNTATVSIDEEIAALSKLVGKPKEPDANQEAPADSLKPADSFNFGTSAIASALNTAKQYTFPDSLDITVKITDEIGRDGGYVYDTIREGSQCVYEHRQNRTETAFETQRRGYDDYKVIYQAASAQVVMHYLARHLTAIRQLSTKVYDEAVRDYIKNTVFAGFSPTKGVTLYNMFVDAACDFADFYLYKTFPKTDTSGDMHVLRYSGKWEFFYDRFLWMNDVIPYDMRHFNEFVTTLLSPSYKEAAEELLTSSFWLQPLLKPTDNSTIKRAYEKSTSIVLWVIGKAKYTTRNMKDDRDTFDVIFQDGTGKDNYLVRNLEKAFDSASTPTEVQNADNFLAAARTGKLNVYFNPNLPAMFKNDTLLDDLYTNVFRVIRRQVYKGVYRSAMLFSGYNQAITECLDKNISNSTAVKNIYGLDLLTNILQPAYETDDKSGLAVTQQRLAGSAATKFDQSSSVGDELFDTTGAPFRLTMNSLSVTKEHLEALLGKRAVNSFDYYASDILKSGYHNIENSPYFEYLTTGSAYFYIATPKGEKNYAGGESYLTLVSPYYYVLGTDRDHPENIPNLSGRISFDFPDYSQIKDLVEKQPSLGSNPEKRLSDPNYKGAYIDRPVLVPLGLGTPDSERVKQTWSTGKGNHGSGGIGDEATIQWWPFVVWFSKGRQAGLVYYNMLNGSSTNMLASEDIVPKDAFDKEVFLSIPTNTEEIPEWAEGDEDLKALCQEIRKLPNPFNKDRQLSVFSDLPDNAYVIYPLPLKPGLDNLIRTLNAPYKLFLRNLKQRNGEGFSDKLSDIDPRRTIGQLMHDRIQSVLKAQEGATAKNNTYTDPEQASSAGTLTGTALKTATDTSFDILFGSYKDRAAIIPGCGASYSPDTGLRTDNGFTWAVAARGTKNEAILSDAFAIRKDKAEDSYHLHGGVDIGVRTYNSMKDDKIKDNWVDNEYTPKHIRAPYDCQVVYAAKFGNSSKTIMSGYGFYAVLVPAKLDDTSLVNDFAGAGSDMVPVILVGHMTPYTTAGLPPLRGILSPGYQFVTGSVKDKFQAFLKLKCSAKGVDNYYFNENIGKSLSDATLKNERDTYMASLSELFDQDTGLLSKTAFPVQGGGDFGCIGNSGTSFGLHYHVNYFMLPKGSKEIKDFYNNQVFSLMVWARSVISQHSRFTVGVNDAKDWGKMQAARMNAVMKLRNASRACNIHEALAQDGVSGKNWELGNLDLPGSFSDLDISQIKDAYDVPAHILVSVVESAAYKEAVARLCTVTPEALQLPYYDPYVMDGGMPAAVVYKNDIILTKVAGVTVNAFNGGATTLISFASGISATRMIPVYLKAMIKLMSRVMEDPEKLAILRKSAVFPFHSLDFYNKYAFNIDKAEVAYDRMFGRRDFVFDWRECLFVKIDDIPYSVKFLTESADPALILRASKMDYTLDSGNIIVDMTTVMPMSVNGTGIPLNQPQLLLRDRAWDKSHLYTLSMSNTDSRYRTGLVPAVAAGTTSFADHAYEVMASEQLESSVVAQQVKDLPSLYYDWTAMFATLRKCIKTARPLSIHSTHFNQE